MLAKRVDDLPVAGTWVFEPKWDGFRALVFRDGAEIEIQSRDEKPLGRYFPELLDTLRSQLPPRWNSRLMIKITPSTFMWPSCWWPWA